MCALSARLTSKSGQSDLCELSIETGQDHLGAKPTFERRRNVRCRIALLRETVDNLEFSIREDNPCLSLT
jgi:hypothetical protein